MKIFSLRKPVEFIDGIMVVHDLARNHQYQNCGDRFLVEGFDVETESHYQVFYNRKGKFSNAKIENSFLSLVLGIRRYHKLSVEKGIFKNSGRAIFIAEKYIIEKDLTKKLVGRNFFFYDGNTEHGKIEFSLQEGKWISSRTISLSKVLNWLH